MDNSSWFRVDWCVILSIRIWHSPFWSKTHSSCLLYHLKLEFIEAFKFYTAIKVLLTRICSFDLWCSKKHGLNGDIVCLLFRVYNWNVYCLQQSRRQFHVGLTVIIFSDDGKWFSFLQVQHSWSGTLRIRMFWIPNSFNIHCEHKLVMDVV